MKIRTTSARLFGTIALVGPVLLAASAHSQTPRGPTSNAGSAGGSGGSGHIGVPDPVYSLLRGEQIIISNTDQASQGVQLNLVSTVDEQDAEDALSLMGHPIDHVESPNEDLASFLGELSDAAGSGDSDGMLQAAIELEDILLGRTQGRIYDGFAMLNFNRGAYVSDHVPGEYKMKTLRDSGQTTTGMSGSACKVWEVDINMLWYDGNFDSDTFLLRVPLEVEEFDTVHVNYTIYSLVREDFSPTTVMLDYRGSTGSQEFGKRNSVQFPFCGYDAVWQKVRSDRVTKMTVALPPIRHQRGVYTWGWREHPPRIQFLQPVYEMINAHTGALELDSQGMSYATRNRGLSIEGIGDAAPEKKIWNVCQAVRNGASTAQVEDMLNDENTPPMGVWDDWSDLLEDQLQLPPEAWDVLANEGISQGSFGQYKFVTAIMNNEMYGEGPEGEEIEGWNQGDSVQVKIINLDNISHYFRNVDFGPKLAKDLKKEGDAGASSHSFELMNFKPTYGAPKVAEMQWRAGWGFRPHFNVIQQAAVFPRPEDQALLSPYTGGAGQTYHGWQYSLATRGGDFRFNPPRFIIGDPGAESDFPLREADGTDGLVIGQVTEGYGVAKMCNHDDHPLGGFCKHDISAYNPQGIRNIDTDGDGIKDVLWFPPFLRNPNPDGGDIIPPTSAWRAFLWINPENGTLYLDPDDPSKGYWADLTYAHGTPVYAGQSLEATMEMPRASGQVFYQFDDLFHDNAIFSPHPKD